VLATSLWADPAAEITALTATLQVRMMLISISSMGHLFTTPSALIFFQESLSRLSSQLDRMDALLPQVRRSIQFNSRKHLTNLQASSHAGSSSARDHVASLLATLKSSAVKLTQDFSSIHKVLPSVVCLLHLNGS
jgi:hypothetical protein